MMDVFDEWVRNDVGRIFVQTFDACLSAWAGQPAGLCIFEETCGQALALEFNGDLYACDHFVQPAWRIGNIMERPLADLTPPELRAYLMGSADFSNQFFTLLSAVFIGQRYYPAH